MINLQNFRLQYITNCTDKYTHIEGTKIVLEAGCRWVQLRIKSENKIEIINIASQIKKLCNQYDNATFIIDDHVDVAKEIDADGVHLGKQDMSIAEARKILGNTKIIGGTANTFDDVLALKKLKVEYVGLGPYRYTTTKQNLSPIIGLNGYEKIFKKLILNAVYIPIVAIGGIRLEDVSDLIKVGLSGIAISGAVLNANDPILYTQNLVQELNV